MTMTRSRSATASRSRSTASRCSTTASSYASSSTSATPTCGRPSRAATTRSSRSRSPRSGRPRCASAPRSCPCTHAGAHTLASTVASMCQAAPGRFALGIGTSSNVIVERWNGIPFDKPYQRVRDTIRFLRAALTGEKVDEEYETFWVHGLPPRHPGARAAADPRRRAAPGHAAARGPRGRRRDHQLAVGRRREDGRAARRRRTRRSSRASSCCRSTTAALARSVGKRAIASYLTVPVYAAFHEWLGRGDELADLWRLWKEGDRKAAADVDPRPRRRRPARVGHPEKCKEHIARYMENGVTTPAPALFCGPDQLHDVIRALAR